MRHRQRRNMITVIKHGNTIATSEEEIAEEVDAYYSRLFASAPDRDFALNMDTLGLPVRDLSHLEAPFTHEEVEKVLKGMPLDKAPGPDGFTGRFYASGWHIIRDDIMRAMEHFFSVET